MSITQGLPPLPWRNGDDDNVIDATGQPVDGTDDVKRYTLTACNNLRAMYYALERLADLAVLMRNYAYGRQDHLDRKQVNATLAEAFSAIANLRSDLGQ